jgi:hypothetical protein
MIDWIKFDHNKPPELGKDYLLFIPDNELGETCVALFERDIEDGTPRFWDWYSGEVQNYTHYAIITYPDTPAPKEGE